MPDSLRPHGCSPPGSSVHGVVQSRILEWVAIPFSRGSSQLRDWTWVSCIADRLFIIWGTREALPDCTWDQIRQTIILPLIKILQQYSISPRVKSVYVGVLDVFVCYIVVVFSSLLCFCGRWQWPAVNSWDRDEEGQKDKRDKTA